MGDRKRYIGITKFEDIFSINEEGTVDYTDRIVYRRRKVGAERWS